MTTILDGKAFAKELEAELTEKVARLKADHDVTPGLAAVLIGDDAPSRIYVNSKRKACARAGLYSRLIERGPDCTQEEVLGIVHELNADPAIHGILVQSPLPDHLDEQAVVRAIDPAKDADGFHPYNVGLIALGEPGPFIPCTPKGVVQLLLRYEIDTVGKHAVIIGRSNIVGKPLAMLLMQKLRGGNCTVTVCHSRTNDLPGICRQADILVSAIGSAGFVTRDMVKPGAVVVDVGINRVEDASAPKGYRVVGDVDFDAVKDVASAITPVPGGVGPLTIAMLLESTYQAALLTVK